jgi:hypothetical protein
MDAVNSGTGKVVKAFTCYKSPEDFFRETACLPKRNFYEIISSSCAMYFDIEHYSPSQFSGDGTPTDDRLATTIATIRAAAMARWAALAADPSPLDHVVVTTASRMVGGVWKHSYHILFYAIGFRINYGALRAFARYLSGLDTLQATNAKMQPMSLVDASVYSRDQNLRITESWKHSAAPSPDMALEFHPPRPHTLEALLQTLATNVQGVTHWVAEAGGAAVSADSSAAKRKRSSADRSTNTASQPVSQPAKPAGASQPASQLPRRVAADLQRLLDRNASGCEATGRVVSSVHGQPLLTCQNQPPARQCIVTRGATHASNAAYCIVRGDYLWLKCHSATCRGSDGACLGRAPPSLVEWLSAGAGADIGAGAGAGADVGAGAGAGADVGAEAAADAADAADAAEAAGRCKEAAHDTASQADDTASQADDTADTAMPDSTAAPFPWHNLTTNDLSQLLRVLSDTSSLDESLEDPETVGPILKKFGYRSFWNAWSAVDSLSPEDRDRMWSSLDAESCTKDLNDVVAMVNARLTVDPDAEFGPCRRIEKIYFPRPFLSLKNMKRITHTINEKYLTAEILNSPSRVTVVESCTGTGKTTSITEHAVALNMPIISVCERVSQVKQHRHTFRQAGMPTKQYDDPDVSQFQLGQDSLVTTIDSLPKVRGMLKYSRENAGKYILLLDEIHSIAGHILFSDTMRSTRRKAMQTLSWLLKHAGKVFAMDNEITNDELELIDTALSNSVGVSDITFIKNTYKKYSGTRVYYEDEAEMIAKMTEDLKKGKGFTTPCNTKKQAERVLRKLLEAVETSDLKLYTSEEGTLPEDINSAWSGCGVIYSPTITTGIDFNPKEAQPVYLFLKGEYTISPAAALQMINRNRNIKEVYICENGMKNKPEYSSFEEMSNELDALCQSTSAAHGKAHDARDVDTLQQLQNSNINMTTDTCEFTETGFSRLYKAARWHENVMRSSFAHMLDGLLELRGFEVVRKPLARRIAAVQEALDWNAIDCLNQQDKATEFAAWLAGAPTDRKALFDKHLAALNGIKHSDIPTHTIHLNVLRNQLRDHVESAPIGPERQIYVDVFTESRVLAHSLNLMSAIYTDEKLRRVDACNKVADFSTSNLDSTNSKVRLMREMIGTFNHGMSPDAQLKQYDLTLKQSAYEEEEGLEISDDLWNHYHYLNKRSTKSRPTTRKALIACIFVLSQELFGKRFTKKTKTSKASDKSKNRYNYTTNEGVLKGFIEMSDWRDKEMTDIDPEVVQMYNLRQRKVEDHTKWYDSFAVAGITKVEDEFTCPRSVRCMQQQNLASLEQAGLPVASANKRRCGALGYIILDAS